MSFFRGNTLIRMSIHTITKIVQCCMCVYWRALAVSIPSYCIECGCVAVCLYFHVFSAIIVFSDHTFYIAVSEVCWFFSFHHKVVCYTVFTQTHQQALDLSLYLHSSSVAKPPLPLPLSSLDHWNLGWRKHGGLWHGTRSVTDTKCSTSLLHSEEPWLVVYYWGMVA